MQFDCTETNRPRVLNQTDTIKAGMKAACIAVACGSYRFNEV